MLQYRAWRYRLLKDVAEIKYLRNNLKKGDIAVDIGAHKAGYTYWMLNRIGAQGKCYAFEPQPVLFNYLKSLKLNSGNLIIENIGLSSKEGSFNLFIPKTEKGSSPSATLNLPTENNDQYEKVEVKTTTLDHYFLSRNLIPQLIKIDVEGHELEVLKGGEKLLSKHHPKLILECEQRHLQGYELQDVFDFLSEKKYQGYFILGKEMIPLDKFDIAVHQQIGEGRFWESNGYVNNFVFEQV